MNLHTHLLTAPEYDAVRAWLKSPAAELFQKVVKAHAAQFFVNASGEVEFKPTEFLLAGGDKLGMTGAICQQRAAEHLICLNVFARFTKSSDSAAANTIPPDFFLTDTLTP